MTQPVLDVRRLGKTYGESPDEVVAVRSATFTVSEREFVSLLGPSGCGKSTILMAIAGLEPPSAGDVRINGAPVDGPVPSLGIAFQDATLLPWRSTLQNVLYPAEIRRLDRDLYGERAVRMLRKVGLGDFLDRKPGELSGGMRQRVALVRALVYAPELLLLDEPFSALDAITREEMNLLLLDLWAEVQTTTILVTHSIAEAILLSDRILVMSARPSEIVAELTVPFARPRRPSIIDDPAFGALAARVRRMIRHQPTWP